MVAGSLEPAEEGELAPFWATRAPGEPGEVGMWHGMWQSGWKREAVGCIIDGGQEAKTEILA